MEKTEKHNEYLLKIAVVGTPIKQIGKMITIFTQQEWSSSVGVNMSTKKIQVDNNNHKLILVSSIYPDFTMNNAGAFFRGASALIYAFDKADLESYVFATTELPKLAEKHTPYSMQGIPTALLGFKTPADAVTTYEAKEVAAKKNMSYFEIDISKIVSMPPNEEYNAVEDIFHNLTKQALETK